MGYRSAGTKAKRLRRRMRRPLPGGCPASEAGPWMTYLVAVEGQSPATPDASPTSGRMPGKRSGAMDGPRRV